MLCFLQYNEGLYFRKIIRIAKILDPRIIALAPPCPIEKKGTTVQQWRPSLIQFLKFDFLSFRGSHEVALLI